MQCNRHIEIGKMIVRSWLRVVSRRVPVSWKDRKKNDPVSDVSMHQWHVKEPYLSMAPVIYSMSHLQNYLYYDLCVVRNMIRILSTVTLRKQQNKQTHLNKLDNSFIFLPPPTFKEGGPYCVAHVGR